jgi:GntR family transcriptional regulator
MLTSFRESLFEEGLNFSTSLLARTVMMPVDDLDARLDIPPDKHIIYIKRLRLTGSEPVLLQESYIPYHICPLLLEDDIEKFSLLELFEKKYGIRITRVRNHIDIAYLSADEGKILGLPENSAAILLTQYFHSGETLFMYTRSVKRPDRFQISIELERKAI